MKVGDVVTVEAYETHAQARVDVLRVRGDFVYVSIPDRPKPLALHRRTGKPRRCHGIGWHLAQRFCDPQAGRGTTR
jgi:hypothetical protein